jgi:hypothetical protein
MSTEPKPRRCGAYTRRRGYTFENETRLAFEAAGLSCRRVPLSGAGDEKGDICVTTGWGERFQCELKRKKEIPAWITKPLGDHKALIIREDKREALAVVRLSDLMHWWQCK